MMNISTKLYENTTMICEVTARTRSDATMHRHLTKVANCGEQCLAQRKQAQQKE